MQPPRPLRPRHLFASLLLVWALPACAATWVCALSQDGTRMTCVADNDGPGDTAAVAPPATAVVNGTRFPLDAARVYTVPLWAPPTEPEFVALLARATICYRTPQCSVVLAPSPWLDTAAAGVRAR